MYNFRSIKKLAVTWCGMSTSNIIFQYIIEIMILLINYHFTASPSNSTCPNLHDPLNGGVVIRGSGIGSLALYSCNTDFTLQGSKYRFCTTGGLWTESTPTCIEEGLHCTCSITIIIYVELLLTLLELEILYWLSYSSINHFTN